MRSFVVAVAVTAGTLGLAGTADAQTYSYWAGGYPSGSVITSYAPSVGNPYAYNPYAYNPYNYNPYAYNPYNYNPYTYNPYASNPYVYNPYASNAYPYVYASSSGRSYRRLIRRW